LSTEPKLHKIIEEINLENGSNYKKKVLEKYKHRSDLKTLLACTYDRVKYTYGISSRTLDKIDYSNNENNLTLIEALEVLIVEFSTRTVTGNKAIERLQYLFNNLAAENQVLLQRVIKRDLRINLGTTMINKVHKNLISKVVYMRCGILNAKSEKDINFPALVQLKADGTYREVKVQNGVPEFSSRSGESYDYPELSKSFAKFPDGVYIGELTVQGITNRSEGNGLINSKHPPHDRIQIELWDYIELPEYKKAALKDRKNPCLRTYKERWDDLNNIIDNSPLDTGNIKLIPSFEVQSMAEAKQICSQWMLEGYEGAVLKDYSGVFKDGTSKYQLKMKIAFSLDVRVTGFIEGTPGTKRAETFGSMEYTTDDDKIKGSVSGFNDKDLDAFNAIREEIIGTIIEIEGNDLTKATHSDHYAVSHPRFIQRRTDKDTTDDLDRAMQSLEMQKGLK
jgi:DNA ligase-1